MDTQIYTGTHTLLPSSTATATFRDMGTQRHSWTEGQTNIDTKVHKDMGSCTGTLTHGQLHGHAHRNRVTCRHSHGHIDRRTKADTKIGTGAQT